MEKCLISGLIFEGQATLAFFPSQEAIACQFCSISWGLVLSNGSREIVLLMCFKAPLVGPAFFNKHIYFPYKQTNVTNSRRVLVQPPACSQSPQAVLLGPLYPSSPLSTDSVSSKSQVHHPVTQTYKAITDCCMLLMTKSSQKYRKYKGRASKGQATTCQHREEV